MSETGLVAAGGQQEEALAQRPVERMRFEGWLIYTAVAVSLVCAYESLAHRFVPAASFLNMLHSAGIMKSYPVVYEPGKGIWRLMGWIGSGMMLSMMVYTLRKRMGHSSRLGSMRMWLNFHMLMGVIGPILITFHTTFKFGGLIGTSYWAMVATVLFGVLGRYIYIQIPRGITGAELSMKEIEFSAAAMDRQLESQLGKKGKDQKAIRDLFDDVSEVDAGQRNAFTTLLRMMATDLRNRFKTMTLRKTLMNEFCFDARTAGYIVTLIKRKAALIRRKNLLSTTHRILRYWHVIHIPLAIVMFAIMLIHIIVYFVFTPGIH
jgi:hypothetical protein